MRQVFIITLLLTLITSSLRGATETISLDGSWKIRTDPQNSGKQNEWFAQSIATNAETRDIQVPGVLQTVFREYHGLVWYERDFRTPENPNISNANINARTLLRFWQAEYRADVWVNGVYLGFHEGGEEAFELDATDALMPVGEQNRLTVRVLNASDEPIDGIALANVPRRNNTNTVTPGNGYASGGLVDSVELLIVPEVRITDLHLIPNWKTGEILVRAEMENYSDITQPFQLTLSAASADGGGFSRPVSFEKSAVPGKSIVEGNLTVPDFRLWELNDPNLYAVTAESKNERSVDRRTATCGFRDFRFENGFFRLNGKRIYVKCSHSGSDSPVTH
ncbi:MAG: hypothetical protein IKW74_07040, partial [Thermoguttaceae bacterium]|nr:hypothetical protein [Thermoguttaceae bacterium]